MPMEDDFFVNRSRSLELSLSVVVGSVYCRLRFLFDVGVRGAWK